MGWMMPNQFLTHVWEGNDPDLWTEMKEFNTNAKVSKASGFSFDSTNVANELTAVQNVYNEYQTSVEYGFVDPETGIAEMNDKMMTAGSRRLSTRKGTAGSMAGSKQIKFKNLDQKMTAPYPKQDAQV